jgi:hypothetical protein
MISFRFPNERRLRTEVLLSEGAKINLAAQTEILRIGILHPGANNER